jgi:YlmC/YmxH family sporulation protein
MSWEEKYNIIVMKNMVSLQRRRGMVRLSDLRDRDVININDGKRLGVIGDLDLDMENGIIKALILPGSGGFMGVIGRKNDLVIPWEQVKKIGVDAILVDCPIEFERA